MPPEDTYASFADLPPLIRCGLPRKAQQLYRAAYDRSWRQPAAGDEEDRARIAIEAHRAARFAVERESSRNALGVGPQPTALGVGPQTTNAIQGLTLGHSSEIALRALFQS